MSHIGKVHLYYQKEGKSRSRDACMLSHFSCVQLFVTLWTCSLPGSSVHGIVQARILQWVSLLQGIFPTRDQTHISYVSCIGKWVLYHRATWEAPYSSKSRDRSVTKLTDHKGREDMSILQRLGWTRKLRSRNYFTERGRKMNLESLIEGILYSTLYLYWLGFLLIVGNNKRWLSFNLKNFLEDIVNCFRKTWKIENKESKEARTRAKTML